MELCPRLVSGPYMRNRFGNPATAMPKCAFGLPAQCVAKVVLSVVT